MQKLEPIEKEAMSELAPVTERVRQGTASPQTENPVMVRSQKGK